MIKENTVYLKMMIIFSLLFICFPEIYSQNIRNINVESGLSNNNASRVVQDWKGFIWVSTKQGIDRFDGTNVANYSLSKDINMNLGMFVIADRNKHIWAYTHQGDLMYFSYAENRFVNNKKFKNKIQFAYFDCSNKLWVSTNNELILCNQKNTINKLKKSFSVACAVDDKTMVLADNYKVYRYDINSNRLSVLKELKCVGLNTKFSNIHSLYYDPKTKNIWIGTFCYGVFVLNIQTRFMIDITKQIPELPHLPVSKIISYSKDIICIATDGDGIFFVDKNRYKLTKHIKDDINETNSLKGNGIYDIFLDKEGVLFAVSYTGGLSIINNKKSRFNVIRNEKNNKNSINSNVITSILEDKDGDLWFSTPNGVNHWDKRNNKWKVYTYSIGNEHFNMFLTLTENPSTGEVLAGSYSRGIMIINKRKGSVSYLFPKDFQQEIGTNFITSILVDKNKNIWSGGYYGELSCYQTLKKEYKYFNLRDVEAMESFTPNWIVVSVTKVGIYLINVNTFEQKKINLFVGKPSGFQPRIRTIAKNMRRNEIWFGAVGEGLICWNFKTGKISYYSEKEGLPSDYVESIIFDNNNLLWGGSDKGLFCIDVRNNSIVNYTSKDGLSDNNFLRQSRILTKNNELMFGSNNGVSTFSSNLTSKQSTNIRLYFNELKIFNQPFVAHQKDSPLDDDIDAAKSIRLKSNQNSFSVSFGSIDLQNLKQVQYQWRLDGLESKWNASPVSAVANYTNIEPGHYEFILTAIDKSSKRVVAEKKIKIEVLPPFWNTTLARLLFLILFLLILRSVYLYLKKIENQKLSDKKVDFFTKTAHDIKTPLSLIMAPINELRKHDHFTEKERYYLNLAVSNIEKLSTIVNQLMDFQKSETLKSKLLVSEFDVVEFVQKKIEVFNFIAQKQGVTIVFIADSQSLLQWLDKDKFERIIDNLISNAIKYTPSGGKIDIGIQTINIDEWTISVKDTGIGIKEQDKSKLFNYFYRAENAINASISGSGVGLLVVKNYVSLHKGKINFNSTQNRGSEFSLIFKNGKSHYPNDVFVTEDESNHSSSSAALIQDKNFYTVEKEIVEVKVKILIVEDNPELLNFMQVTLGELFTVKTATNGVAALEIINNYVPELIVSDVQMPEMDGLTFASILKSNFETSHIPIILLSALSQKDQILCGIESGVDDYITKPFDIDLLIAKIHGIIKNRQLLRAKFIDKVFDNKEIKAEVSNQRDLEFIERVLALIEEKLEKPDFNKAVLAREMAVSETLLYSKLKHITGEAPSDLIRIVRLKKSMELLKTAEYTVYEVALMTGFNDSKYFSTIFKKYYGKTPSEINK